MTKLVWLHKRKAGMEPQAFHNALVAIAGEEPSIAGLSSYVQSHTLIRGYSKGNPLFDAVEEFSFADPASLATFLSEGATAMQAKRAEHLDPGSSMQMTVDVHRVKDRPVPAGAVKNVEFVNRRPGMELTPFRKYWRGFHGPLASHIPSILRYEQNHIVMDAYEGGAQPRYDGLAVTWFTSTDAMREGARTQAYAETRADEPNFLPDGHLPIIIAREVLFR